jgi:hypothetical protein
MRLEVGGALVLGGVPLFPCRCVVSPLPLPLLGSPPSLSLFHPQSTPRAVARRAGGGWCIVVCHTSFIHCLVLFIRCRPLSVVHRSFVVIHRLSYVIRSSSSVVCHTLFVHCSFVVISRPLIGIRRPYLSALRAVARSSRGRG